MLFVKRCQNFRILLKLGRCFRVYFRYLMLGYSLCELWKNIVLEKDVLKECIGNYVGREK